METDTTSPLVPLLTSGEGKYRHNKTGKLYEVIGIGKHSETLEDVVIYKPLYRSEVKYWVRPVKMWEEKVIVNSKRVKRFEKIK